MNYAQKLKLLRERIGLTNIKLGEILGISDSLYSRYEKEKQVIPLKHLLTLCDYYNVSVDYLFSLTDKTQYKKINKVIDNKLTGNRIKEFRKENKLTQVTLANDLHTVHQVIANYENGKHLIALPFLYELCKKYKISADYLLGRIDKKIMFKD